MAQCLPRDWIGAPLRLAYADALDAPGGETLDALLLRLDDTFSLQTFAQDLAAAMPKLRAYARSLTRDGDAADDLVQDTLLKAWKARDRFAPGTSLRAWTCTILRNGFLTQRRRARFAGEYDEEAAEIHLARPEAQTAAVELADVRRAMEELSADQREALGLVSIEGLSYEEGAHRLGISLGSFKSRVSRGRTSLRLILDGEGPRTPPAPPPPLPAEPSEHRGAWAAAKAAGQRLWIG